VPGTYAKQNEIIELAREAANQGGIYATHMRNEGTELEAAVAESIRVATTLDMALEISHLKGGQPEPLGRERRGAEAHRRCESVGPQGAGGPVRLHRRLVVTLDQVSIVGARGRDERMRERFRDPDTWARIKQEVRALYTERGFSDLSWATVASYRADPSLNGLSMKQVAEKISGRRIGRRADRSRPHPHDRRGSVDGLSLHGRR
jgi:N-acyl-D-amino-acid deacylase